VTIDVEKAAADASGDLVKKVTQIAIVGAVVAIVLFVFWPQIAKVVEAVDTVKRVPGIENRIDKMETDLRENSHDRKEIRRDLKELQEKVYENRQVIERIAPRVPAAPPGWQITVTPAKPGT
jgi:septal ring factor EnvC (AmiA/AmiB activator)